METSDEIEEIGRKAVDELRHVEEAEKQLANKLNLRVTKQDRYDLYWSAALFLAVFTVFQLIGLRYSWANMVFCIPAFVAVLLCMAVKFRRRGGKLRSALFAIVGSGLCTALIALCDWIVIAL